MEYPQNPQNQTTQIAQYFALQIQIEILILVWICTKEFEFWKLVGFEGVAISLESVIR